MGILSDFRRVFNNIFFTPVLYGAVASLSIFLIAWDTGDRLKDKFQDKFRSKEDTFDFIVVGGGVAGSVVATRLAEWYTVLLLEAGGEPHPFQDVPALSRYLHRYPEVDWCFKTVPQRRACLHSEEKRCSMSSGKGLGGSANINLLSHLRGHPRDFDNWAEITGDPSWSYDSVLQYFQRSEDFSGNSTDMEAHAYGGPLHVELPDYILPAKEFLWAGAELGYPNVDLNGHFHEGFDALYYPILKGVRQTTYKTYAKPAKKWKNLTVRKFGYVTELMLRNNDLGAYGLKYDRHKKSQVAYARKEIILSAGAIQTATILLRSGIGPKEHLRDMGIRLRNDLPVGKNLQDHLAVNLGPFFVDDNGPHTLSIDRDVTKLSFVQFAAKGTGPLTTSGEMAAGLVTSYEAKSRGEKEWPDILLVLLGVSVHANFASDLAHAHGLKEDILKEYYTHAIKKESFHIRTTAARPASRGEVRLTSRDPYDPVYIDGGFLEDPWDLDIKVLGEAMTLAVQMVENTTAYQNLGGHFTSEVLPGCDHVKFKSPAYFECFARHMSVSAHDYAGTCAMGKPESEFAVVDSELKVIGTNGLRVIDASVMPALVSGSALASTIMIAEKGADLILQYWAHYTPETHEHYSGFANSLRSGDSGWNSEKKPGKHGFLSQLFHSPATTSPPIEEQENPEDKQVLPEVLLRFKGQTQTISESAPVENVPEPIQSTKQGQYEQQQPDLNFSPSSQPPKGFPPVSPPTTKHTSFADFTRESNQSQKLSTTQKPKIEKTNRPLTQRDKEDFTNKKRVKVHKVSQLPTFDYNRTAPFTVPPLGILQPDFVDPLPGNVYTISPWDSAVQSQTLPFPILSHEHVVNPVLIPPSKNSTRDSSHTSGNDQKNETWYTVKTSASDTPGGQPKTEVKIHSVRPLAPIPPSRPVPPGFVEFNGEPPHPVPFALQPIHPEGFSGPLEFPAIGNGLLHAFYPRNLFPEHNHLHALPFEFGFR